MTDEDNEVVPRIAILGAGPIGLESALYARYLGYDVAVLEKGTVGHNVLRWGHVKMFSPFSMNRSALGLAALKAQDERAEFPDDEALLCGQEYAQRYLIPLSKSDLVADSIHEQVEVLGIGRDGVLKSDAQNVDRGEYKFRILVKTKDGDEVIEADTVLDTTGVFDQPNFCGHGGIPAIGELACRQHIHRHVPDVLGVDRAVFANKRVLVIGSGYSAATAVTALAQLARSAAATKATWVTRRASPVSGPVPLIENDQLSHRTELARQANDVASSAVAEVEHLDQTSIVSISREASTGQYRVKFGGKREEERTFDEVISNVGYRPNAEIYSELQVEQCAAGQGPKKMSEWIRDQGAIDALHQTSPGRATLQTLEPGFFILGSKSFGRNSNFLLSLGLQQVRDVFTIIADRADLDLYKTMSGLVE